MEREEGGRRDWTLRPQGAVPPWRNCSVNQIPTTLHVNGAEQGWKVGGLCVTMGKSTENAQGNCRHLCWIDLEKKKKVKNHFLKVSLHDKPVVKTLGISFQIGLIYFCNQGQLYPLVWKKESKLNRINKQKAIFSLSPLWPIFTLVANKSFPSG